MLALVNWHYDRDICKIEIQRIATALFGKQLLFRSYVSLLKLYNINWNGYVGQRCMWNHYGDVIMGTIASQVTSFPIVYSTVYSDAGQRKHQSSASLAFVRGIHRGPVNAPHKWPVTRKMFPFHDVIMMTAASCNNIGYKLIHVSNRGPWLTEIYLRQRCNTNLYIVTAPRFEIYL